MGAPKGNTNAAKGTKWRNAIERALERRSKKEGIDALDALADQFLDCVMGGAKDYFPGFSALGDRLDGKPAQQIALTDAEGGPVRIIATATDERI